MIDQLLDVTQARLAGGIPVSPSKDERDLVALVALNVLEVLDEDRAVGKFPRVRGAQPHLLVRRDDTTAARHGEIITFRRAIIPHGRVE